MYFDNTANEFLKMSVLNSNREDLACNELHDIIAGTQSVERSIENVIMEAGKVQLHANIRLKRAKQYWSLFQLL